MNLPPRRLAAPSVAVFALLVAPHARAEDDAPSQDTVTVRGKAPSPSRGVSDFQLRIGELSRVPRQNASDLLKLAPGILLTNKGGDGHAEQIFLRGFDAREGQDVELSAGGVPINEAGNLHGNGYADMHFIMPELVEGLRVIEGPFDPRQGNFAVAGSAAYELGLASRGLIGKYTQGSFATQRMFLGWGPAGESRQTFAGAELYDTDGFGQNRAAKRASAMGQYEGKIGKNARFLLGTQAYSSNFKSAGVLRADDVDRGRFGMFDSADKRQGGESERYSVWGEIEKKTEHGSFSNQVFYVARDMRLRENFTGFLLDTQQAQQTPHPQRGDLLDLSVGSSTLGSRGAARWHQTLWGKRQELEVGYFARADRSASTQHRIESATNAPYLTETDLDARLGNIALYVDGNVRILDWLTLRGGLRGEYFSFDVLDHCAQRSVRQPSATNPPLDASCLSQQDFGRYREPHDRRGTASTTALPRGSMLVGPFDGVTISASAGKGIRSIDPVYINQDLPTPFASITATELGVGYARGVGRDVELTVRSIFFQTHVDRDLIFNETAGRATLANGTTRTGWAGTMRATGSFFDQAANITLVRSTFDDTRLLVPYVPDVVVRSDSSLHAELPWSIRGERLNGALSSGITYVGRRPLPFAQRSDEIFTVDASASVAWRNVEVALVSTNLFDMRYRLSEFNYASDFRSGAQPTLVPSRHFAAGAPRGVFLTLTVNVGGPS